MRTLVKKEHPTVTVAVRAPVDVLVAPLVKALLLFPEVSTLYSCQGSVCTIMSEIRDKKPIKGWDWNRDTAWVSFTVGDGSGQAIATFLDKLLATLNDGTVEWLPRADWSVAYHTDRPQGRIRLEQGDIPKMVKQLKRVHRTLHPRGPKGV